MPLSGLANVPRLHPQTVFQVGYRPSDPQDGLYGTLPHPHALLPYAQIRPGRFLNLQGCPEGFCGKLAIATEAALGLALSSLFEAVSEFGPFYGDIRGVRLHIGVEVKTVQERARKAALVGLNSAGRTGARP